MNILPAYLDLLDSQREAAFAALDGLSDEKIWQRPAPKEWSLGEIIDHNYLLIASFLPLVRWTWNSLGWYGRLRRQRPYATEIDDVYRRQSFPMWVGFLWTPRHTPRKPVPLAKDEAVLGNLYLYDPIFGFINLIVTLRIGIYHDQLHFDDVFKLATTLTGNDRP